MINNVETLFRMVYLNQLISKFDQGIIYKEPTTVYKLDGENIIVGVALTDELTNVSVFTEQSFEYVYNTIQSLFKMNKKEHTLITERQLI